MRFLVIQTAFLGDAILATAVLEKLHTFFSESRIDFMVRKGNESAFENHPFISDLLILDKTKNKLANLLAMTKKVKKKKYDCVINLHRFASSGFIVWCSGAREKIGFDKNPFSFCFTRKIKHTIGDNKHETERNQQLIMHLTDASPALPKLYPPASLSTTVSTGENYLCIAPASVWHTKQFPVSKWVEFIKLVSPELEIYLIGGNQDIACCEEIRTALPGRKITNLAGKLNVLQTAALMKGAKMNYVNDSAPLHMASAVNAPVTAIFCSTVPEFGFGPLSEKSKVIETKEKLNCRPCGLHGHQKCPESHFHCAMSIDVKEMLP